MKEKVNEIEDLFQYLEIKRKKENNSLNKGTNKEINKEINMINILKKYG